MKQQSKNLYIFAMEEDRLPKKKKKKKNLYLQSYHSLDATVEMG
jgi:hypothetical protein